MMEVLTLPIRKTCLTVRLGMAGLGPAVATFTCPDLSTFCRLDELGLEAVGQHLGPDRAVLACRVTEPDQWCRRCRCEGISRESVTRELAHEPLGWRPATLVLTVRRYQCAGFSHVWR